MSGLPNASEEERAYLQGLVEARPPASHLTARLVEGALVLLDERWEQPRAALRFRRTSPTSWITDISWAFEVWSESGLEGSLPEVLDALCEDFSHYLRPNYEVPEEEGPSLDPEEEERMVRFGRRAALLCAAVWLVILALCWILPWGYLQVTVAIIFGWVWSIATLGRTDSLIGHVTRHAGMGEWLGPLLFLFVPLFTPVGFILTLARGIRILRGRVDGGVVSGPGSTRYFDEVRIGRVGQGTALTMFVLALAHPAALAVFVFRLDLLTLMEIVPA